MGLFYPKIVTTYFCGSLTLKMVDLTLILKSMSKWTRKWLFFSFFENGRFTSRFTIGFGLKKFAATLDVKCLLLRVFRGIYFESYFILSECEFRILISVSISISVSAQFTSHELMFMCSRALSRCHAFPVLMFSTSSQFSHLNPDQSQIQFPPDLRVHVCVLELYPS